MVRAAPDRRWQGPAANGLSRPGVGWGAVPTGSKVQAITESSASPGSPGSPKVLLLIHIPIIPAPHNISPSPWRQSREPTAWGSSGLTLEPTELRSHLCCLGGTGEGGLH